MVAALIAVITVAVYWPVRHSQFINYDDPQYVTDNANVLSGLTWQSVKWSFQSGHASNWHPLTWISHMLDVECFGEGAGGPHLVNVLLHAASAFIMFLFMRRLTSSLWSSAWVAAMFALHPLHVESVAWIAERKDVLSTFLGLVAMYCYVCHLKRRSTAGLYLKSPGYWLAFTFFVLALLSKPMVVTLPFVFLLIDWWQMVEAQNRLGSAPSWRLLLLEKIPFLAISAASCVVTWVVQSRSGIVADLGDFPFHLRLENAVVSYARYLGGAFWPAHLSIFYPHPGQWPWEVILSCAMLILVLTSLAIWQRRYRPYIFVGWFWYLGMLVPVIGLVQMGVQSMADRYTYLPLTGIFLVIAMGAADIFNQWICSRRWIVALAMLTVAMSAVGTRLQLRHWRSSETLFLHALSVTQNNALACERLGSYYFEHGNPDESIRFLQQALEIDSQNKHALHGMGCALTGKGRYEEAGTYFERTLQLDPYFENAHYNLANTLAETGRSEEALEHYRIALQRRPDSTEVLNNFGRAYADLHRLPEAIMLYRQALSSRPDYALAHYNLADALLLQGQQSEAKEHYLAAITSDPDIPEAQYKLGAIFMSEGDWDGAINCWRKAVNLKPDAVPWLNNLAWALATGKEATVAQGNEAANLINRAMSLTHGPSAQLLDTMAAAYARMGRFDDARITAVKAIGYASASGNDALEEEIRHHLESYESGKPWDE